MNELFNALLMVILVLNLFALGSSRMASLIRIVAAQGVILGLLPLLESGGPEPTALVASAAAIALKAAVIPLIMSRALRDAGIKREVEPLLGFLPSVLMGALGTAAALLLSGILSPAGSGDGLVISASIATILSGALLLVTRYKAITQVIGYLVLENGVYVFSLLLIQAIPLVVEMGMLLDLFVGVFVISIITNHINRAFSSLDTRELAILKEE